LFFKSHSSKKQLISNGNHRRRINRDFGKHTAVRVAGTSIEDKGF
jgi:hypothetical protein